MVNNEVVSRPSELAAWALIFSIDRGSTRSFVSITGHRQGFTSGRRVARQQAYWEGTHDLPLYRCRLTSQTIAKWELTLETSYKTMQKVFAESVGPSIERIILLLEEMRGWSMVYVFHLLARSDADR